MWTAIAYLTSAALLLWAVDRALEPLSRRAGMALAAMPLAVAGKALLLGRVYAPIDYPFAFAPLQRFRADFGVLATRNEILSDLYCQIIPWHKAVRWALAHGDWPLWNPFIRNGDILAAAAQPAPYFPPNLISYLLPLPESLTYLAAAHFLVAAVGAFLWTRSLGCRESAALVGAFGWMAADSVAWWIGWPLGAATAAAPWILLGVRRVVAAPGARPAALLAAALAWSLLAGHPETLAHAVLLGAAYGVFELLGLDRSARWRPVAWAGAAGLTALAVCAVYLLPILDALPQTFESAHRQRHYAATDRSLEPLESLERLQSFGLPFRFGYPHREVAADRPEGFDLISVYAGSTLWPLALYGLAWSRRRERWFLLGAGLVSALAAVSAPGISDLLARLPVFDLAINERLAFGGPLALAALAALGVERALEDGPRRVAMFAALALGAAAVLMVSSWPVLRAAGLSAGFLATRGLALLAPLVLVALVSGWRRAASGFAAAMLLLLAGQRAWELAGFYPSLRAGVFYPRVAPLGRLPEEPPLYRVVGRSFALPANIGTLWELEDPRGYNAMTFRRLLQTYPLWSVAQGAWFNRVDDLGRPFLDFLNVRYAVVDRASASPPPGWKRLRRVRGLQLWENERALPRAFVPRKVLAGGDWPQVLERLRGWTSFHRRAWISHEVADPRTPIELRDNGRGEVEIRRDGTGYRLDATMAEPGWIATSITAWRGWRAVTEDGSLLPLAYANHAFLAIAAPAGSHRIRLVYRPASFVAGAWVSAAAVLALVGLGIAARAQRARSASIASP